MTLHTMIGENHGVNGDSHGDGDTNTNISTNTVMPSAAGHFSESNHGDDNDNDHHTNKEYSHRQLQSQPHL
jgi:hypothetical protein